MAKEKKTEKTASKKEKHIKKGAEKATKKGSKKSTKKAEARVAKPADAAKITTINLADFTCPCCSKRCLLSKPKCGKGKAIAKKKLQRAAKAAKAA